MENIEAVVAPLSESSLSSCFGYVQPSIASIMDFQCKHVAVAAGAALENLTGCTCTEGMQAVA